MQVQFLARNQRILSEQTLVRGQEVRVKYQALEYRVAKYDDEYTE